MSQIFGLLKMYAQFQRMPVALASSRQPKFYTGTSDLSLTPLNLAAHFPCLIVKIKVKVFFPTFACVKCLSMQKQL